MTTIIAEVFVCIMVVLAGLAITGFYLCILGGWIFSKIKRLCGRSRSPKAASAWDEQPWGF